MNLAPKLLGPQWVVLAALVALTTIQVLLSSQQGRRLEQSVRRLSDAGIQLQQLGLRTAELHRDLLILRAAPTPRMLGRIGETAIESRALLGLLESHEFGPRERGLVRDLRRLHDGMAEVQGRVVRSAQAGASAPDAGAYVSWWYVSQKADAILAASQLTRALAAGQSPELLQPIGARIDRQLRRTARLIDDLLDVSRMKAQRLELRTERFGLTPLVNEVLERFADQFVEASIVVTGDRDPTLWVDADPSRVDQVLVNLLSNAVKYAPTTSLEVRVFSEGADAVVSVRDEGAGIPSDLRVRLFEPFARPPDARASGLGLGLFISRSIMEAHQGRLDLLPGDGGAHFQLRLPRRVQSPLL